MPNCDAFQAFAHIADSAVETGLTTVTRRAQLANSIYAAETDEVQETLCLELLDQDKLQSRPATGGDELSDLQLALLHGFPEVARRIIARTGVPAPPQGSSEPPNSGTTTACACFSHTRSLVVLAAAVGDAPMVQQLVEAGHSLGWPRESAKPLVLGLARRRVMFGCKDGVELLATLVALGAAESSEQRAHFGRRDVSKDGIIPLQPLHVSRAPHVKGLTQRAEQRVLVVGGAVAAARHARDLLSAQPRLGCHLA